MKALSWLMLVGRPDMEMLQQLQGALPQCKVGLIGG
jgi:hypothetical protein